MKNICCLLDACTVINLIYIDEDDFLLKKLIPLDIIINDTVFTEIRLNVYNKLKNHSSKYSNEEKNKTTRKEIDQKLSFFRGKKNDNMELFQDVGSEYYEQIKDVTGYTKRNNGELCSAAHALYLSRVNEKKVFFYTDDYPAKEFFSSFFEFQQIGHIKDSVDFLILVYWIDEYFTGNQLDKVLGELHSQYAMEVVFLKERLENYYKDKVDATFIKSNKDIAAKLKVLILSLNNFDFKNIKFYWEYFENKKGRGKEVFEIFKQFYTVFEIDTTGSSETLLEKIRRTRTLIKNKKVYKWSDLMAS